MNEHETHQKAPSAMHADADVRRSYADAPVRRPTGDNFALQSLFASGALRAKLRIGGLDDAAEAEADRMASAALRGGAPAKCGGADGGPGCAGCGPEATVRSKPNSAHAAPAAVANLGLGGGRGLGRTERNFFEARMDSDFSAVRVHDDERAVQAAKELDARAFTVGRDIVFGHGEYEPHTESGRELLAHELAHVAQAEAKTIRRQPAEPKKSRASTPPSKTRIEEMIEQIEVLRGQLESMVLSDEGRAESERELAAVLGKIGNLPVVLTAEQSAVVERARKLIAPAPEGLSDLLVPPPRGEMMMPTAAERLAKVSPLVKQTVRDVDGDVSGSRLYADAQANQSQEALLRWALELQSIPRSFGVNYLRAWYLQLDDWDEAKAMEIGQKIADQGVDFGLMAQGFNNLEHIDPKEALPAALDPAVRSLDLSHGVDNFVEVRYDLNYKPRWPGRLSTILQLVYKDGAVLDLDLDLISDDAEPAWFQSFAHSYVGPAGRVFPLRLGRQTTPRLWAAKHAAIAVMEDWNLDFTNFVSIGLAGVMANLPIGPVTFGPEPQVGPITSPKYDAEVAPGGTGAVRALAAEQALERELAAAAGGTGSTTRMVTNLTRSPEPGRALSVAIGDAAETLASTARASGKLYEARVPTAMITVMEQRGLVQRSTTSMYGVVGTELRFAPSATQYVVRFFKPVP